MTDVDFARPGSYGTELAGAGYPAERVSLVDLLDS
jgi:hypothetical protein